MMSQSAVVGLVVLAVVSLVIPIAGFIVLKRKYGIAWRPLLVGMAVFIVFSQVLEKGLHVYMLYGNEATKQLLKNPFIFALYGALAAGIFEELGRYVGFTFLLKKHREYKDGLALGLGHGGIEAILIGLLFSIQNIVYIQLMKAGQLDTLLKEVPAETAEQLKQSILDVTFWSGMLGSVERIAAFFMQIAFSLLVLYAVRAKKFSYVLVAILIHAAVDYVAALYQVKVLNLYIVEAMIALIGVGAFLFIRKSKALFR